MVERKLKTPAESAVETRYIVMPDQVNAYGTVFGGVIMSWIDMVAEWLLSGMQKAWPLLRALIGSPLKLQFMLASM